MKEMCKNKRKIRNCTFLLQNILFVCEISIIKWQHAFNM